MKRILQSTSFSRHTFSRLIAGMLLALGAIGCSSQDNLTITSLDRHQTFRQGFTHAYSSRNGNGDMDVVLIDSATEQELAGRTVQAPVSQVMHIRLLWSPTRDMTGAASNASVKWYVIGRSTPPGLLEYSGIAIVSSEDNNDQSVLKVRNSRLALSSKHGNMVDWIGLSNLEGTFTAHEDRALVDKVLSQLHATVAAANNAQPDLSGREHAMAQ